MDTKVLNLEVDLGDTKRAPVAEIANYYTPEQLASETVILVVNLKPSRLMAVRSEGCCWGQWSRKMGSGQYWIAPCRREPL